MTCLPLWEGFDEWAHYSVIQNMVNGRKALIGASDKVSREVQVSLVLAPRRPGAASGELEYGAFWKLREDDRLAREGTLKSLPSQLATITAPMGVTVYEAQQAPLYYWLLTPVYSAVKHAPFLDRVWTLRLWSFLIGSCVIPLVFLASREVLGCEVGALCSAALASVMPQLMMSLNHIGNECLSIPLGTFFVLCLLRWKHEPRSLHHAALLGATLGLALLTKAYFLALLPPVVLLTILWTKRYRVYGAALLMWACALSVSGWWYVRSWRLTHALSGEQIEVAGTRLASLTHVSLIMAIRHLPWRSAVDFVFMSHIWLGNWSFLVVRSWMYHTFAVGTAFAIVCLGLHFLRKNGGPLHSDTALLASIWASFAAALGYQAIRNFQATGAPGTLGYYLLAIIGIETILVTVGLEQFAAKANLPPIVPLVALAFTGLEFFGMNFYVIPYYTGTISRLPDGRLPALSFNQLAAGGFFRVFARLASEKPDIVSPSALTGLWFAFLLASISLIIIATWAAFGYRRVLEEQC